MYDPLKRICFTLFFYLSNIKRFSLNMNSLLKINVEVENTIIIIISQTYFIRIYSCCIYLVRTFCFQTRPKVYNAITSNMLAKKYFIMRKYFMQVLPAGQSKHGREQCCNQTPCRKGKPSSLHCCLEEHRKEL